MSTTVGLPAATQEKGVGSKIICDDVNTDIDALQHRRYLGCTPEDIRAITVPETSAAVMDDGCLAL